MLIQENGWTLIQSRFNGKTDFYRSMKDYEIGFGYPTPGEEFWIGLDTLNHLTLFGSILRVELTDWFGNMAFVEYSRFFVDSFLNNFTLSIGDATGMQNKHI